MSLDQEGLSGKAPPGYNRDEGFEDKLKLIRQFYLTEKVTLLAI